MFNFIDPLDSHSSDRNAVLKAWIDKQVEEDTFWSGLADDIQLLMDNYRFLINYNPKGVINLPQPGDSMPYSNVELPQSANPLISLAAVIRLKKNLAVIARNEEPGVELNQLHSLMAVAETTLEWSAAIGIGVRLINLIKDREDLSKELAQIGVTQDSIVNIFNSKRVLRDPIFRSYVHDLENLKLWEPVYFALINYRDLSNEEILEGFTRTTEA